MNMRSMKKMALVVVGVSLIAACSSGVKLDDDIVLGNRKTPPIENRNSGQGGADSSGTSQRAVTPVEVTRAVDDPNNPVSKRSVYFEYDSYTVRDQDKPVIEAHARYLNAAKARKVVLQGNTDERGSREYNLALGQKRSEAVKRALAALGVPEAQLEAVSFGEEKPKATGNDEAAFAENRRVDLAYD